MTYPAIRWYFQTFFALSSPPYTAGNAHMLRPMAYCRTSTATLVRPR